VRCGPRSLPLCASCARRRGTGGAIGAASSSIGAHDPADNLGVVPAYRAWLIAWLGGSVLGVVNGVIRETTYKDRVGDLTAKQISAGTLTLLLALYFWVLHRRWPIRTTNSALQIGVAWVVLTILFEFGFGHYVDRKSWSELFENYDLTGGNLWLLVLVWILAGPVVVRALQMKRPASPG
jgi:hypothetical protein